MKLETQDSITMYNVPFINGAILNNIAFFEFPQRQICGKSKKCCNLGVTALRETHLENYAFFSINHISLTNELLLIQLSYEF